MKSKKPVEMVFTAHVLAQDAPELGKGHGGGGPPPGREGIDPPDPSERPRGKGKGRGPR